MRGGEGWLGTRGGEGGWGREGVRGGWGGEGLRKRAWTTDRGRPSV